MSVVKGQLIAVYPKQDMVSKEGRPFTKCDFIIAVVEVNRETRQMEPNQSNTPMLTAYGHVVEHLNRVQPGDMVDVYFTLQGRRYREAGGAERVYTNIRVSSVCQADDNLHPTAT